MGGGDRGREFLEDVLTGPVMLPGNPASSLLRLVGDKGSLTEHSEGEQEAGRAVRLT